jgi:LysM repeat protein
MDNFQGSDKILLKLDSMEKEESFYISENNQLVKQAGYYIYYEKNEEMQNYMVENKEAASEEKNYTDHTTKKIRNVIQEKKDVKEDKSVIRLLYAASTLLAIIVLVIAATMLDNYDKMRNMETALNTISQSLNLNGNSETDETDSSDLIQQADNHTEDAGDTQSAEDAAEGEKTKDIKAPDDKDAATEVETVKGNVEADPETDKTPGKSENNKPADNKGDNNNQSNTETALADNEESNGDKNTSKDNEEAAVEASAPVKYYKVQAGDSLAAISFELYHTFSYMDEIKELNGIEDEDKIYEGQKLIVP